MEEEILKAHNLLNASYEDEKWGNKQEELIEEYKEELERLVNLSIDNINNKNMVIMLKFLNLKMKQLTELSVSDYDADKLDVYERYVNYVGKFQKNFKKTID